MLPSLSALRAFGEAGRTGSFKAAAETLNVSPTAISHHIRHLEADLGVALFVRDGRNVTLTPRGEILCREVTEAFLRLNMAVNGARRDKVANAIRIAAGPFFAARWLMPRLETFWAEYPDISLEVVPVPHRLSERDVDADIVISWEEVASARTVPLIELSPIPIASPDLIRKLGRPAHPSDLLKMPLIHQRDTSSWAEWFSAVGVSVPDKLHGAVFEDANVVLRGAIDGQGVTLGWMPLIQTEIEKQQIMPLFDHAVSSNRQYFLSPGARGRNNVHTGSVIGWLRSQGESHDI